MLAEYFSNVYNIIISISGMIALIGLIAGGIMLVTSAGNPEKLTKAKKQIMATFLGVFLLLASYFLLKMINPNLVDFEIAVLDPIPETPLDVQPTETFVPDLLGKIRETADQVKLINERIETTANDIVDMTNECDCSEAQSLCACDGGDESSRCQPLRVYSENNAQPCPDGSKIKESQKNIIAWKEEIVYYRNRAVEEEKDMRLDLEEINELSVFYSVALESATDPRAIEELNGILDRLARETFLKETLALQLKFLVENIDRIVPPVLEIAQLPSECLTNVKDRCEANCRGECMDELNGCQPEDPSGGNPCPTEDIESRLSDIRTLRPPIDSFSDEIINVIEEIIRFKTITI